MHRNIKENINYNEKIMDENAGILGRDNANLLNDNHKESCTLNIFYITT